ncbi:hypothetical protein TVAGG3_0778130 [Trichomonas vaginalis G3]|uniref:hypothetical protein n=1 Tax=Trichomonas vaginalis (strain ATCC PRA-98 / G3) TaxID=412133 RepID=UPI0021E59E05|nr:hypothetical protein TVAGG3_0778130 [Trichomonas vaginalis G3]KAI5494865.1 hypothetical protein TVAGG3_0778130 [Trichomonas vaginalis G3]
MLLLFSFNVWDKVPRLVRCGFINSSYCSIFDLATNEQVENKNSIQSEMNESLDVKQKFLVNVLSRSTTSPLRSERPSGLKESVCGFILTVDDTINGFK